LQILSTFFILSSELHKHAFEAAKWDLSASSAQLAFWEQLLLPTPDLGVLISLSRNINESIASANAAYQRIFKLQAGMASSVYLRMYAALLSDVACDDARAARALRQAQSSDESPNLSMSDFLYLFLMHLYSDAFLLVFRISRQQLTTIALW
jgi:hypothetical protein